MDHRSVLMIVRYQCSLNTSNALVGKRYLARQTSELGFKIEHFVTNNSIFRSQEFLQDLDLQEQTIHFSVVRAKHQNEVAEIAIKTVSTLTRTMVIHASLRWPAAYDLNF